MEKNDNDVICIFAKPHPRAFSSKRSDGRAGVRRAPIQPVSVASQSVFMCRLIRSRALARQSSRQPRHYHHKGSNPLSHAWKRGPRLLPFVSGASPDPNFPLLHNYWGFHTSSQSCHPLSPPPSSLPVPFTPSTNSPLHPSPPPSPVWPTSVVISCDPLLSLFSCSFHRRNTLRRCGDDILFFLL